MTTTHLTTISLSINLYSRASHVRAGRHGVRWGPCTETDQRHPAATFLRRTSSAHRSGATHHSPCRRRTATPAPAECSSSRPGSRANRKAGPGRQERPRHDPECEEAAPPIPVFATLVNLYDIVITERPLRTFPRRSSTKRTTTLASRPGKTRSQRTMPSLNPGRFTP